MLAYILDEITEMALRDISIFPFRIATDKMLAFTGTVGRVGLSPRIRAYRNASIHLIRSSVAAGNVF